MNVQYSYTPTATSRSISYNLISQAKRSLDFEISLNETTEQRLRNETYSELYSILTTLNQLEKLYVRDKIREDDYYTKNCLKLINQANLIIGTSNKNQDEVSNDGHLEIPFNQYVEMFKLDTICNLALKRLRVGIPSTIEHLNYFQQHQKQSPSPSQSSTSIPMAVSDSGTKGKLIAEATGSFITLMDAIKLNYNSKEQLHPLLTDIITLTVKIFPEFNGKANLVQWLIKLNSLKIGEYLSEEELKEFLWDVEVGYKGFFSLLG